MADQNSCGVALGLFTASSSLRLLSPDLGHEGSHGIVPQLQTLHSHRWPDGCFRCWYSPCLCACPGTPHMMHRKRPIRA